MTTDIAERFARETTQHQMTILHDDGLYRHLRFADQASLDWFDLITWPFNLIANGSHGSFHFSRFGPDTEDMFVLFRDGSAGRRVNPGYWEEKLRGGASKDWSETKFREWLTQEAAALETRHPGLFEAVSNEVLDSDEHNLEYEETARYALAAFGYKGARISFPDPWERTFTEFDWKYLWSCHAIAWGISQYDAPRVAVAGGAR